MFKTNILIFSLFMLASCGRQYPSDDKNESAVKFSSQAQTIEANARLENNENTIAQRICYAFKSKRTTFSVQKIGSSFSFNLKNYNCNHDVTSNDNIATTLSKNLSTQELLFSYSGSKSFFSQVQTDLTGFLKDTCSEIFQSRSGYKTFMEGPTGYEYVYFAENGIDKVVIKQGPLSNSGDSYTPQIITRLTVQSANSFGAFQGFVSKYEQFNPCPSDTSKVETFEQSYLGF